jgi:hypothetical protein
MCAIIDERYDKVTLKNDTLQMSAIKTDALMNSVHNIAYYVDLTGDAAFISSEIRILKLCKSARHV